MKERVFRLESERESFEGPLEKGYLHKPSSRIREKTAQEILKNQTRLSHLYLSGSESTSCLLREKKNGKRVKIQREPRKGLERDDFEDRACMKRGLKEKGRHACAKSYAFMPS